MGTIAAYYMNQQHNSDEYTAEMREQAYRAGAAVAFGLMGMAEAIRVHYQCTLGHTWCGPAPADDVCVCCGHVGRLDTRDRGPDAR